MTTRLEDLRESNEFLNLLLTNINSAVLIVDEHLNIHQFNDFFINLFDKALGTFVEKSFGQVAGCVNAVTENKPCGETSKCKDCILRKSLIQTLHARRLRAWGIRSADSRICFPVSAK